MLHEAHTGVVLTEGSSCDVIKARSQLLTDAVSFIKVLRHKACQDNVRKDDCSWHEQSIQEKKTAMHSHPMLSSKYSNMKDMAVHVKEFWTDSSKSRNELASSWRFKRENQNKAIDARRHLSVPQTKSTSTNTSHLSCPFRALPFPSLAC